MKTLLAWGKLVYAKKEIKGENNNNKRRKQCELKIDPRSFMCFD